MSKERDRELLAAEYAAGGHNDFGDAEGSYLAHCALRAISQAREEGRREEREAVVAWLRDLALISATGEYLATQIEQSAHVRSLNPKCGEG